MNVNVLIRFWVQKVKDQAGGGITVDASPSSKAEFGILGYEAGRMGNRTHWIVMQHLCVDSVWCGVVGGEAEAG